MTKSLLETDIFNYHTPEFFVNMKSIPDKSSPERGAFIISEKEKCRKGINVNGVYIPGSLYFHLNYYKLQGDSKTERGKMDIFLPTLRDNEWVVFNDYDKCQKEGKIYILFGLRQCGKSEMEVSLCLRELSLYKNTEALSLFGAKEYKDNFVKKMRIAIQYGESFIVVPNIDKDWDKSQIRFGITKPDNSIDHRSTLYIYNTQEGKKIQVGSGKTPSFFLIDEAGTSPFRAVYDTVEPALLTDYGGLRCSPMFTLTGGEATKAKDAENFIKSPSESKQFITTLDDGRVVGGRFLSGLYRKDCKKETTFSKFIGQKTGTWLDNYPISVSDFDLAKKKIEDEKLEAERSPDRSTILLKRIFFPLNLDDVFLTQSTNNFPISEITEWQNWLKDNYEPQVVDFYTDIDGKIKHRPSKKGIITEFPCKPTSNKEAGQVIYEDYIEGLPFGTYCGGLDLYNQNESSDRINSLGSYYILKRMYDPLGEFQYSIVASYSARPTLKEFKENVILMMKYYNAYTLPELTNTEAIDWFIERGLGHYFAEGLGIAKEVNPFATSGHNTKGVKATPAIQKHYMNIMVGYTKEVLSSKQLETGIVKDQLGLTRILDIMLLDEMKNYRSKESTSKGVHDGNFDRCFPKGHNIITSEGYKDISKIEIDDFVLTHNGSYEKVYQLFKNEYNGELVKIKPIGNDKFIESTPNHPFLIGRYSKKPHGRSWYKRKDNLDIINWVKAKDIKKGDFMFIPFKKDRLQRTLSDDILYLLGWYLSDGNISKQGRLKICFQGDQLIMAERCKNILEKYDEFLPTYFESTHHLTGKKFESHIKKKKPSITKIKDKYAFNLECTSDWFNSVVAKYVTILEGGEKILNQNLINQKDLIPLILGFFEGDGSQIISNYDGSDRHSLTLSGTYLTMIRQFREIILNEGIWCTISLTKAKDENYGDQLRIDIQDWDGINKIVENSLKFKPVSLKRKQKENFLKRDNGFWIPIKNIETTDYQGFVYNIEVENDHSYVVDSIATHNCVGFGHALMLARHLDKVQPLTDFKFEHEKEDVGHNVILHGTFNPQKKNNKEGRTNSIIRRPFIMR